MTTVAQVQAKMQRLMTITADALGRETGFIQRERTWSGSRFAQTLVFGWMGTPTASLSELSQAAANLKVKISRQGLDQRFTENAACFMQRLLEAVLGEEVIGPPVDSRVLGQFKGVYVVDSTCLLLLKELSAVWPGCGGRAGENACLKVSVVWNVVQGSLCALDLMAGRSHDQHAAGAQQPQPRGSLRLADLGYFNLKTLARDPNYWLFPYKNGTGVWCEGERLDVLGYLSQQEAPSVACRVEVGVRQRLPARLLARRVSAATLARRQLSWQLGKTKNNVVRVLSRSPYSPGIFT